MDGGEGKIFTKNEGRRSFTHNNEHEIEKVITASLDLFSKFSHKPIGLQSFSIKLSSQKLNFTNIVTIPTSCIYISHRLYKIYQTYLFCITVLLYVYLSKAAVATQLHQRILPLQALLIHQFSLKLIICRN